MLRDVFSCCNSCNAHRLLSHSWRALCTVCVFEKRFQVIIWRHTSHVYNDYYTHTHTHILFRSRLYIRVYLCIHACMYIKDIVEMKGSNGSVLQSVVVWWFALVSPYCIVLRSVEVNCSVLHCVAVLLRIRVTMLHCCIVALGSCQCVAVAVRCSALQCVALHSCDYVALCCIILHSIEFYCSVLHAWHWCACVTLHDVVHAAVCSSVWQPFAL